jgi:hypothetical protein
MPAPGRSDFPAGGPIRIARSIENCQFAWFISHFQKKNALEAGRSVFWQSLCKKLVYYCIVNQPVFTIYFFHYILIAKICYKPLMIFDN